MDEYNHYPCDDQKATRKVRWCCRLAAIALCGLHAYTARHTMNPDGVSYLDLASGIMGGDLHASLNPYWSPLYPWLLARTLAVVQPSAYWECAIVHGVNFGIFLAALAAFEWLLHEWLLTVCRLRGKATPLPECWLTGLAYCLFAWMARRLVTVSVVTPDMLVAVVVFLATALTLRIRRRGPHPATSAVLGLILAGGYLAKAVLFPLGFVFLGASVLAARAHRRATAHLAVAAPVFVLVAGGYLAALSVTRGYATFGDSGKLNYAWYVGRLPRMHASAEQGPAHPPRRLAGPIAAWEFADPIGGTYPLWYDPAYWCQGLHAELDLRRQISALGPAVAGYFALFGEQLLPITAALAVLVLFTLFGRGVAWRSGLAEWLRLVGSQFPLLLPAMGAVGLYALVGHVEGRLIGPFVVLLGMAVLGAVRAVQGQEPAAGCLARACLWMTAALLGVNLLFDGANAAAALIRGEGPAAHAEWRVAQYLRKRGLQEKDSVGFVGFTYDAYWARLGGVRIVAEVPETEAQRFWSAPDSARSATLASFRQVGARAVLARRAGGPPAGWEAVPGTDFICMPLSGPGREREPGLMWRKAWGYNFPLIRTGKTGS
jgi:hypothetical protein